MRNVKKNLSEKKKFHQRDSNPCYASEQKRTCALTVWATNALFGKWFKIAQSLSYNGFDVYKLILCSISRVIHPLLRFSDNFPTTKSICNLKIKPTSALNPRPDINTNATSLASVYIFPHTIKLPKILIIVFIWFLWSAKVIPDAGFYVSPTHLPSHNSGHNWLNYKLIQHVARAELGPTHDFRGWPTAAGNTAAAES